MSKKINTLLIVRKSYLEIDWILPVFYQIKNNNLYTLFVNEKAFNSLKKNTILYKKWKKINKSFYIQNKFDNFFLKFLRYLLSKLVFKKKIFLVLLHFLNYRIHDINFLKKKLKLKNSKSFDCVFNEFQKISFWTRTLKEKSKKIKIFLFPHTTHIYSKTASELKAIYENSFKIICDGIFLGSKIDSIMWLKKISQEKIYITGHPKYSLKWRQNFFDKKKRKVTKILFCIKDPYNYSTFINTKLYLEKVYDICKNFNYLLEIKLPPYYTKSTLRLINFFKRDKINKYYIITDNNIFSSLNDSRLLINFNKSATTLDAVSCHIPTIQLPAINDEKANFGSNDSIYTSLNLVTTATNPDDLEQKILRILKNHSLYKKKTKKTLLKIFPDSNKASKKIEKIIFK